jgi:hypothetical protein
VNAKLIQVSSEMDYRRTQVARSLSRSAASSVTGTMGDYSPSTGQQKITLPNGGVMRTKNISNSGVRLGDVVPAVNRTATGQAFSDSRG